MNAKGRVKLPMLDFNTSSMVEMTPFLERWIKEGKKLNFTLTGEATLRKTENDLVLMLNPLGPDSCDLLLETWYQRRTLTQLNTLKALESLLYQIDYQRKPKSKDLEFIHQGILEIANERVENPWTKKTVMVTTSMKCCDTKIMDRFIEVALEELAERNIPKDVRDAMFDRPLSEIFREWYKQRMVRDDLDGLTWNEYRKRIPYCEFTFKSHGPLERMHIISKGANGSIYEQPWNWIHASRHIHQEQHNNGWESIMQDYPHIIPKINRAHEMERKLNEIKN